MSKAMFHPGEVDSSFIMIQQRETLTSHHKMTSTAGSLFFPPAMVYTNGASGSAGVWTGPPYKGRVRLVPPLPKVWHARDVEAVEGRASVQHAPGVPPDLESTVSG